MSARWVHLDNLTDPCVLVYECMSARWVYLAHLLNPVVRAVRIGDAYLPRRAWVQMIMLNQDFPPLSVFTWPGP